MVPPDTVNKVLAMRLPNKPFAHGFIAGLGAIEDGVEALVNCHFLNGTL